MEIKNHLYIIIGGFWAMKRAGGAGWLRLREELKREITAGKSTNRGG
jgi:hypothetical protein